MVAVGAARAMKTLASNDLFTDFPIIQSYYRSRLRSSWPEPMPDTAPARHGSDASANHIPLPGYRRVGQNSTLPVTAITGVPCRRILAFVNTNGAFRNMQSEALAARADGALQRHRELRMEFDMLRARADAERGLAHAWKAIGSSQQYGTLRERMAILMLAEAFFRANEYLAAVADH